MSRTVCILAVSVIVLALLAGWNEFGKPSIVYPVDGWIDSDGTFVLRVFDTRSDRYETFWFETSKDSRTFSPSVEVHPLETGADATNGEKGG